MTEKKNATADLAQFDALTKAQEDGIDVEINGPDGQPLGFSIRVAGPDSERQRKAQQKQIDARLRRRSTAPMSAEDMALAGLQVLADSTISWTPFILDGGEFAFSPENAVVLYQRLKFVREQVDAAAGSRADFLPK